MCPIRRDCARGARGARRTRPPVLYCAVKLNFCAQTHHDSFDPRRKIIARQRYSGEEAKRGEVDLKTDDHVHPPMLSLEGLNSNERPNGRATAQNVDRAGRQGSGGCCLGVS